MSDYPAGDFAGAVPWAVGAVAVVLLVTFLAALRVGRHSVIDTAWGLLFVAVACVGFALSTGDSVRRWLLFVLPVLWGLRLAIHIGRRSVGKPEDPRYEKLLAKARHPNLYALRMVYLLQGLLALLVAAPVLVGTFARGPVGWLAWLGVAVWTVGVFFEAVGDRQLEEFRGDPANRGTVMDRGLWRYTRHPNYFGDCCVWWGVFLVAAERWPGVLTIPSTVLMTYLLTAGSGARVMERHMSGRPGWEEYVARTSKFVPWPPKRS